MKAYILLGWLFHLIINPQKNKKQKKYELNDVFLFKDPSQIKIPYYD